jgi:GTP cyclohydrolase I
MSSDLSSSKNSSTEIANVDVGIPVSQKIREKLKNAKQRFHANDNIADFLDPGDLEAMLLEVESKMESVLDSLVIDTKSDHNTQETAKRVAKMFVREVFGGRYTQIHKRKMDLY